MYYLNVLRAFVDSLKSFDLAWTWRILAQEPVFFLILATIFAVGVFMIMGQLSCFTGESHGGAKFASAKEAEQNGILKSKEEVGHGVVVGKIGSKYAEINGHCFICAPSRSGKGIGPIVSTLLTYMGSAFVNDPKGELLAVTRRAREEIGQKVYILDPFCSRVKESARYNPLFYVDVAQDDCYNRVNSFIKMLCVSDKPEEFFNRKATDTIIAACLYVCENRGVDGFEYDASLIGVRDLLALPTQDFIEKHASRMAESGVPAIRNAGQDLISLYAGGEGVKTYESVKGTVAGFLTFLDDPKLRRFFGGHDVPLHLLRCTDATVYFIASPTDVVQCGAIARVLFSDALSFILKPVKEAIGRKANEDNVLLMIDEFPQLSYMPLFASAMGIMQGLGGTIVTVCQDTSQMEQHYNKNWSTFPSNSACLYLGAKDFNTAKYISDSLGQMTVVSKSKGADGKISVSEAGKPLMSPDEIMSAGPKNPIFFPGHMRPIKLKQLRYFSESWLNEKADPNPFFKG